MGETVMAREAVILAPGKLEIQTRQLGPPGPGEVLIASEVTLPSPGTELAVYDGYHQWIDDPDHPWSLPFRPGYSHVGRVLAVGPDVEGLEPGQRVLSSAPHATHVMRRMGRVNRFAPYAVPDDLDPAIAVFASLAQFGLAAVLMSRATMGRSVAVQGLGAIGQLTLRLFAAAGAYPLLAVDPVTMRQERALAGGAEAAYLPEAARAPVLARTGGGADIVADATGRPEGVMSAMELAADGGQVVVVGSPRGLAQDVNFYPLHNRCLSLVGAHGSFWSKTRDRRLPMGRRGGVEMLLAWLQSGRLQVLDLITQRASLEDLPEVYRSLRDEKEAQLAPVITY